MGALYRSEDMSRCQLYLQTESAYACIAELGELGLVQFMDLNADQSSFQRKFVNEVRRCDEMERRLRYLEHEIKKDEVPMLDSGENPDAPQPREMVDLEATFERLEVELREVNGNEETLKRNFLELTELKSILKSTQTFFDEREDIHAWQNINESAQERHGSLAGAENGVTSYTNPALDMTLESGDKQKQAEQLRADKPDLNFVTGVLLQERMPSFERLLWRACRGNVFLKFTEITEPLEDPVTRMEVRKAAFIIFFQGDQLKLRVKKICEGFRATLYPCPESPQERRSMSVDIMTRIEDLNNVLSKTQDHRHRVLVAAAQSIRVWFTKVRKIKAIYHTLNHFNIDVTQKCLIADCWCPVRDLDKIQLALKKGVEATGDAVPPILQRVDTSETPPTYFRTNKFTQGFQSIVDAYGVATYREVNPAPYTIISFPFLFAIMFGDAGHGIFLTLFGSLLVFKERAIEAAKVKDEIFKTFFGGRYIILLMGIFSIYTGSIYNDVFSKSFNVYGSGWRIPNVTNETLASVDSLMLDPLDTASHPYPWGMDPVWQLAPENKLVFLNSFKMKMSVIIGVFQMVFGVLLSLQNHIYYKRWINVFCEFMPQLIFLCFLFLYLCIEIFYKWTHFGVFPIPGLYPGSFCSPQLLIGFINMFMFTNVPMLNETSSLDPNCANFHWYPGQFYVQAILFIIAILCIPWMLIIKPCILIRRHNAEARLAGTTRVVKPVEQAASTSSSEEEITNGGHDEQKPVIKVASPTQVAGQGAGHGDEEEFSAGDVFIHQAIHTIEFCLGCISHTASYLRLWALSLAHAELSDVLWTMVMTQGFKIVGGYPGVIALYIIFAAFAALTVAILIVMEGLSAFLHALRLHWVEFNSKFYKGEGYAFLPFSFDTILEEAENED